MQNAVNMRCILSKKFGYILLAILLGIQLHTIGSYLMYSSRLQRTKIDDTFKWEYHANINAPLTRASLSHTVNSKTSNVTQRTVRQCQRQIHSVSSRFEHKPEVTSLHIDYDINGVGECPFYKQYGKSRIFSLGNDTKQYYIQKGVSLCFMEGTKAFAYPNCTCHEGWHGRYCSMPSLVWYSDLPHKLMQLVKPRIHKSARRIIHALPFNIEFAMLDARLAELGDVVDVFLILESNYTAYGHHKPLRLLDLLCKGKYWRYAHKIVHIWLDYFPKSAYVNGWIIDKLQRNYISEHSLKHILIGHKDDDIFLLTDADELPSRETLLFLKTHTGYPEPISHSYVHTIYGFFWKKQDHSTITSTISIGILQHVLERQAYYIRGGVDAISNHAASLNTYLKSHLGVRIRPWSFGNNTHPSGWHCSWCFNPEGIKNKLLSAQNGDFPRWGDFPEKVNINYIRQLIATGTWFDDKTRYNRREFVDCGYAPAYFLVHNDTYSDMLDKAWATL